MSTRPIHFDDVVTAIEDLHDTFSFREVAAAKYFVGAFFILCTAYLVVAEALTSAGNGTVQIWRLAILAALAMVAAIWRYRTLPAENNLQRLDRLLLTYEPVDKEAYRKLQRQLNALKLDYGLFDEWRSLEQAEIARQQAAEHASANPLRFVRRKL